MTRLQDSSFALAEGLTPAAVQARLGERFGLRVLDEAPESTTWYDTFDARLGRAGAALASQAVNGSRQRLLWRAQGDRLEAVVPGKPPAFGHELPSGPLRRQVAPLVAMRRLLPQFEVHRERLLLELLDDEDKVVVRVGLEHGRVREPRTGEPWRDLPILLHVRPVRGYVDEHAALLELLEELPGLAPVLGGTTSAARRVLGLPEPADPSTLRVQLAPRMRADTGLRQVLVALLDTLELNLDGLREDLDTEFLHDVRVATRRTRALLRALPDTLPETLVRHVRGEFSWFGRLTGPTRDLDVFQLALPRHAAALGDADLEPLRAALAERRHRARRDLVKELAGERATGLLKGWRAFLEGPSVGSPVPEMAAADLEPLVSHRLAQVHKRILRASKRLEPGAPVSAWHKLRLNGKRLRYLLDCFASLYDPEALAAALKALRRLQSSLGDFNDAHVQELMLRDLAPELGDPAACVEAGRLIEHLRHERARHLERARARLDAVCSKANRKRFQALVGEAAA